MGGSTRGNIHAIEACFVSGANGGSCFAQLFSSYEWHFGRGLGSRYLPPGRAFGDRSCPRISPQIITAMLVAICMIVAAILSCRIDTPAVGTDVLISQKTPGSIFPLDLPSPCNRSYLAMISRSTGTRLRGVYGEYRHSWSSDYVVIVLILMM